MTMDQLLPVLLVDEDQDFRQELRILLNFYSNNGQLPLEIVAEAAFVEQAVNFVTQKRPALILFDLGLTLDNGIATLIRLKEIGFIGKVLILSDHQEDDAIFRAMQAGAAGYIFKNHLVTQLCEAIATALKSEIYLPTEVANGFFRRFWADSEAFVLTRQKLQITEREQEILHWLLQGDSNEEIAKHLYITVATVKAHLTSIFKKLRVTSQAQAIVTAFKFGLIPA
ncbi:response regulator transcription factor [Nostoc sp.]|uniref:response regulator transcription factor n=1 Tax=Nostoc sp. TaxID=1180 RepID=UPI002FFD1728